MAEVEAHTIVSAAIHFSIFHLDGTIDALSYPITLKRGNQVFTLEWAAPPIAPRGYGLIAELHDPSGTVIDTISTAFDVLSDWTSFPRYGFLTDFATKRSDVATTLDSLTKFHINGLQFYDWQYRHDKLLPFQTEYIDPLGRSLSLDTVRDFIGAAHARGMAAMPYLAVYAASLDFWRAHPEWALYDAEGQPVTFHDFLGLMDPTPGSPWMEHLHQECSEVLAHLPFDGLHVDQYGDPKEGFTAVGDPIDIPTAFSEFIHTLKEIHPRASVVFNAVGNWPIEELANAPQDFVYIEIWEPNVRYRDIRRIVAEARSLSGGKAVVIALYLPGNQAENVLLADALIFSLGGSRIELGEKARLLADPYFPKHEPLSPSLKRKLRRYYDFVVRYGEWLGPSASVSQQPEVNVLPGVWTVVRTTPGWLVLNLINISGLGDPRWDKAQPTPTRLTTLSIQLDLDQSIRHAWWASPDSDDLSLAPITWILNDKTVSIVLPELDHWVIIVLELKSEE